MGAAMVGGRMGPGFVVTQYILHRGDCLDVMRTLADASIDACVTDAPYGLSDQPPEAVAACLTAWLSGEVYRPKGRGFMGREWDAWVPGPEAWREVLRVLKPGAHLVVFAGTRTQDLMGMAMRLAGFEIRDTLQWIYGSGFPKSLDVSKATDKAAGAIRPRVPGGQGGQNEVLGSRKSGEAISGEAISGEAISGEAIRWDGWGTALKPAYEPIILARKPLVGTVAANVQAHGTGAINVDGCRIGVGLPVPGGGNGNANNGGRLGGGADYSGSRPKVQPHNVGRWPANILLDESSAAMLDAQTGTLTSGDPCRRRSPDTNRAALGRFAGQSEVTPPRVASSGGASRFFYTSKASAEDREGGLYARDFEAKPQDPTREAGAPGGDNPRNRGAKVRLNSHPTVKPTDLMRWLCRLVTPPGGLILDPFMGSGSTGVAALLEGFHFVGIDREAEYVEIARHRLKHAGRQPSLFDPPAAREDDSDAM